MFSVAMSSLTAPDLFTMVFLDDIFGLVFCRTFFSLQEIPDPSATASKRGCPSISISNRRPTNRISSRLTPDGSLQTALEIFTVFALAGLYHYVKITEKQLISR